MKLNIISFIYYDISEKSYTQQLIRESSFITEHIVRGMHNYDFFNSRRINFICSSQAPRAGVRKYGCVSEMDVMFNTEYFLMSCEKKRRYLFDLLYSSLLNLCRIEQWDFLTFQILFRELENNNYSSEFYTKLHSKRNGINVRLLGVQQIDKLSFYLEFNLKNNKIVRMFFFESKTNVFDYDRFLGKLEWRKTNEIVLIGKDNSEQFVAHIETALAFNSYDRSNRRMDTLDS